MDFFKFLVFFKMYFGHVADCILVWKCFTIFFDPYRINKKKFYFWAKENCKICSDKNTVCNMAKIQFEKYQKFEKIQKLWEMPWRKVSTWAADSNQLLTILMKFLYFLMVQFIFQNLCTEMYFFLGHLAHWSCGWGIPKKKNTKNAAEKHWPQVR